VVHDYVDRAQKHVRRRHFGPSHPQHKMTRRHPETQGELLLATHERGSAP